MSKISFIEKSHEYIREGGDSLISVSSFIDSFKPKVDWPSVAKKVAAKQTKAGSPTTATDILKKWERKRDIASQVGTLFHTIQEQDLINNPEPSFYGKTCEKECSLYAPGGAKISLPINQLQNNTVYPEMMIYDEQHMICGQADKVIVVDDRINIWDYKTDENISMRGFSNQWVSPKKMLPPISHMDECNGNTYSLKMSLYMYMLWKANKGRFLPGDLIIEHITLKRNPDDDNLPVIENGKPVVLKIEQIKLPYRKKEVEALLKTI